MNALNLVGIYVAAKTITVVVEEYCFSKSDPDSLIGKTKKVYHRFVNEATHFGVKVVWHNLPLAIVVHFVEEERVLFMLVQIVFFKESAFQNLPVEGWRPYEKSSFLLPLHIMLYSAIIATMRLKGVDVCHYLKQRLPASLGPVLQQLSNIIDIRPFLQRKS